MNTDSQLKETLFRVVKNAVKRMEILECPADRLCLFNEYKEWLGENIDNEVLAMPSTDINN